MDNASTSTNGNAAGAGAREDRSVKERLEVRLHPLDDDTGLLVESLGHGKYISTSVTHKKSVQSIIDFYTTRFSSPTPAKAAAGVVAAAVALVLYAREPVTGETLQWGPAAGKTKMRDIHDAVGRPAMLILHYKALQLTAPVRAAAPAGATAALGQQQSQPQPQPQLQQPVGPAAGGLLDLLIQQQQQQQPPSSGADMRALEQHSMPPPPPPSQQQPPAQAPAATPATAHQASGPALLGCHTAGGSRPDADITDLLNCLQHDTQAGHTMGGHTPWTLNQDSMTGFCNIGELMRGVSQWQGHSQDTMAAYLHTHGAPHSAQLQPAAAAPAEPGSAYPQPAQLELLLRSAGTESLPSVLRQLMDSRHGPPRSTACANSLDMDVVQRLFEATQGPWEMPPRSYAAPPQGAAAEPCALTLQPAEPTSAVLPQPPAAHPHSDHQQQQHYQPHEPQGLSFPPRQLPAHAAERETAPAATAAPSLQDGMACATEPIPQEEAAEGGAMAVDDAPQPYDDTACDYHVEADLGFSDGQPHALPASLAVSTGHATGGLTHASGHKDALGLPLSTNPHLQYSPRLPGTLAAPAPPEPHAAHHTHDPAHTHLPPPEQAIDTTDLPNSVGVWLPHMAEATAMTNQCLGAMGTQGAIGSECRHGSAAGVGQGDHLTRVQEQEPISAAAGMAPDLSPHCVASLSVLVGKQGPGASKAPSAPAPSIAAPPPHTNTTQSIATQQPVQASACRWQAQPPQATQPAAAAAAAKAPRAAPMGCAGQASVVCVEGEEEGELCDGPGVDPAVLRQQSKSPMPQPSATAQQGGRNDARGSQQAGGPSASARADRSRDDRARRDSDRRDERRGDPRDGRGDRGGREYDDRRDACGGRNDRSSQDRDVRDRYRSDGERDRDSRYRIDRDQDRGSRYRSDRERERDNRYRSERSYESGRRRSRSRSRTRSRPRSRDRSKHARRDPRGRVNGGRTWQAPGGGGARGRERSYNDESDSAANSRRPSDPQRGSSRQDGDARQPGRGSERGGEDRPRGRSGTRSVSRSPRRPQAASPARQPAARPRMPDPAAAALLPPQPRSQAALLAVSHASHGHQPVAGNQLQPSICQAPSAVEVAAEEVPEQEWCPVPAAIGSPHFQHTPASEVATVHARPSPVHTLPDTTARAAHDAAVKQAAGTATRQGEPIGVAAQGVATAGAATVHAVAAPQLPPAAPAAAQRTRTHDSGACPPVGSIASSSSHVRGLAPSGQAGATTRVPRPGPGSVSHDAVRAAKALMQQQQQATSAQQTSDAGAVDIDSDASASNHVPEYMLPQPVQGTRATRANTTFATLARVPEDTTLHALANAQGQANTLHVHHTATFIQSGVRPLVDVMAGQAASIPAVVRGQQPQLAATYAAPSSPRAPAAAAGTAGPAVAQRSQSLPPSLPIVFRAGTGTVALPHLPQAGQQRPALPMLLTQPHHAMSLPPTVHAAPTADAAIPALHFTREMLAARQQPALATQPSGGPAVGAGPPAAAQQQPLQGQLRGQAPDNTAAAQQPVSAAAHDVAAAALAQQPVWAAEAAQPQEAAVQQQQQQVQPVEGQVDEGAQGEGELGDAQVAQPTDQAPWDGLGGPAQRAPTRLVVPAPAPLLYARPPQGAVFVPSPPTPTTPTPGGGFKAKTRKRREAMSPPTPGRLQADGPPPAKRRVIRQLWRVVEPAEAAAAAAAAAEPQAAAAARGQQHQQPVTVPMPAAAAAPHPVQAPMFQPQPVGVPGAQLLAAQLPPPQRVVSAPRAQAPAAAPMPAPQQQPHLLRQPVQPALLQATRAAAGPALQGPAGPAAAAHGPSVPPAAPAGLAAGTVYDMLPSDSEDRENTAPSHTTKSRAARTHALQSTGASSKVPVQALAAPAQPAGPSQAAAAQLHALQQAAAAVQPAPRPPMQALVGQAAAGPQAALAALAGMAGVLLRPSAAVLVPAGQAAASTVAPSHVPPNKPGAAPAATGAAFGTAQAGRTQQGGVAAGGRGSGQASSSISAVSSTQPPAAQPAACATLPLQAPCASGEQPQQLLLAQLAQAVAAARPAAAAATAAPIQTALLDQLQACAGAVARKRVFGARPAGQGAAAPGVSQGEIALQAAVAAQAAAVAAAAAPRTQPSCPTSAAGGAAAATAAMAAHVRGLVREPSGGPSANDTNGQQHALESLPSVGHPPPPPQQQQPGPAAAAAAGQPAAQAAAAPAKSTTPLSAKPRIDFVGIARELSIGSGSLCSHPMPSHAPAPLQPTTSRLSQPLAAVAAPPAAAVAAAAQPAVPQLAQQGTAKQPLEAPAPAAGRGAAAGLTQPAVAAAAPGQPLPDAPNSLPTGPLDLAEWFADPSLYIDPTALLEFPAYQQGLSQRAGDAAQAQAAAAAQGDAAAAAAAPAAARKAAKARASRRSRASAPQSQPEPDMAAAADATAAPTKASKRRSSGGASGSGGGLRPGQVRGPNGRFASAGTAGGAQSGKAVSGKSQDAAAVRKDGADTGSQREHGEASNGAVGAGGLSAEEEAHAMQLDAVNEHDLLLAVGQDLFGSSNASWQGMAEQPQRAAGAEQAAPQPAAGATPKLVGTTGAQAERVSWAHDDPSATVSDPVVVGGAAQHELQDGHLQPSTECALSADQA